MLGGIRAISNALRVHRDKSGRCVHTSIRNLNLAENWLGDSGADLLVKALATCDKLSDCVDILNSSLEFLNVNDCGINITSMQLLRDTMYALPSFNQILPELKPYHSTWVKLPFNSGQDSTNPAKVSGIRFAGMDSGDAVVVAGKKDVRDKKQKPEIEEDKESYVFGFEVYVPRAFKVWMVGVLAWLNYMFLNAWMLDFEVTESYDQPLATINTTALGMLRSAHGETEFVTVNNGLWVWSSESLGFLGGITSPIICVLTVLIHGACGTLPVLRRKSKVHCEPNGEDQAHIVEFTASDSDSDSE
jgi:hypothetical protein